MWIYIWVFTISIFLFYFSERRNKKDTIYKLEVFSALLLPCLLAGLRDESIGTDVKVYVSPLFQCAKYSDGFRHYLHSSWLVYIGFYKNVSEFEIGFTALVFIAAKLFGTMSWTLFLIHSLIIVPVYTGLSKLKGRIPIWLGMLVFYLIFFNNSLNWMRQWIAIAILIYAFPYLLDWRRLEYFISIAIACLFHSTGLLGIVIYFVYEYSNSQRRFNSIKLRFGEHTIDAGLLKVFLTAFFCVVFLYLMQIVVALFDLVGFKYLAYINGTVQFSVDSILIRLPFFLFPLLFWNQYCRSCKIAIFTMNMVVMDMACAQLSSIYSQSARIGVYFSVYNIITIPMVYGSLKNKVEKSLMLTMVVAYSLVYFWYSYVYLGSSETIPYIFRY